MDLNKKNVLFYRTIPRPGVLPGYGPSEPEFALVQALIDAQKNSGLTQKELSERTGIAQSDISKFENGDGNPSVKTLQRLAAGMGMRVSIEFRPIV